VKSPPVVRPQIRTPGETTVGLPPSRSHARAVRWWRELILVVAFYAIYDAIRGVIAGSVPQAQSDAVDLLRWERWTRLDPEHTLNNALQHTGVLAIPACYFYATLHFIVTPAVLIWTYRARPAAYRNARTVLAVVTASALIGFWRFPTAPPRLLTDGGFHDTPAAYGNWGWWGSDASVPAGAAAIANQFAAMPSLHMAWAAWCGATVFRLTSRRWLRALAVAYPALTALAVLGTANRYLADAVAGAGLWLLADRGVRHLSRPTIIERHGTVRDAPLE
jgi:PAP2 superfamily